jgi:hypothetical protein
MDEKQLISRLGYMAADLAGTIEGDAADAAIQRLADLTAKLAAAEAERDAAEAERRKAASEAVMARGSEQRARTLAKFAQEANDAAQKAYQFVQADLAAAAARAERVIVERDALIEAWPELDDGEEGASRRVWAANGLWWAETADGLVPESSRDAAVRVAAGLSPADEPAGPGEGA